MGEIRRGEVGELELAGEDFRGRAEHRPFARRRGQVRRGQRGEGDATQIREAKLECAVAEHGRAGQPRRRRERVRRHRLDQAGRTVAITAWDSSACAYLTTGW